MRTLARSCIIVLLRSVVKGYLRKILIDFKKIKARCKCNGLGAPSESRTPDTMIKSHVLYLLS